jgi:hypothetical protein
MRLPDRQAAPSARPGSARPAAPSLPVIDLLGLVTGRGLSSSRWQTLLAMGVMAVLGIAFIAQTTISYGGLTYFSLADDAMISMTYAKNLADGHGLTWTPGETPVEGYTNPLWTLWMAVIHVLTPVDRYAPLLVALSGLVCMLAAVAGANRLAWRLKLTPAGRIFALLSAATLYAPMFWALRGFEVGLLMALQTWMLVVALDFEERGLRKGVILGLLAAAAFLTRMDSLVISGAILCIRMIGLTRETLKGVAAGFGILAATALALLLFRYAYYGDLLPNTVYLKLEQVSLWERLRQGLAADWHTAMRWAPLGFFALLAFFLVPRDSKVQRLALLCTLGVIALQFAYTAWIGGDAWEWSHFPNRFLSLTAMPLCVAAGLGFGLLVERLQLSRRGAAGATLAAVAVCVSWIGFNDWRNTFAGRGFQFDEEKYLIESGLNLKAATPPGFRYAITWAGTIPYYAEGRRPVDLLGKMDRVIAHSRPEPGAFKPGHNKFDLDYSLGVLRPDAMLQPPEEDDPHLAQRMRSWGYVTTSGGWWILPASARRLTDARILYQRFWWGPSLPVVPEQVRALERATPTPHPTQAATPAAQSTRVAAPREGAVPPRSRPAQRSPERAGHSRSR